MIRITYLSQAAPNFSSIDLLYLLEQCHVNNPKLGLTGLLIFGNETFLQTIEGENHIVEEIIDKISKDKRHIKFQVLSKQLIENRQYSNWAMGFEKLTEQTIAEVPKLKNFMLSDFNPEYLSSNDSVIESLLERHRSSHWDPLIREINARDEFIVQLRNALAAKHQQLESSMLLIESIVESANDGGFGEDHLRLCKSMLSSLRNKTS
ncbi:MAG: BLUF domain-containing protein [Burkholderiaceae bacterium]|jgi:hypothetical protein